MLDLLLAQLGLSKEQVKEQAEAVANAVFETRQTMARIEEKLDRLLGEKIDDGSRETD